MLEKVTSTEKNEETEKEKIVEIEIHLRCRSALKIQNISTKVDRMNDRGKQLTYLVT